VITEGCLLFKKAGNDTAEEGPRSFYDLVSGDGAARHSRDSNFDELNLIIHNCIVGMKETLSYNWDGTTDIHLFKELLFRNSIPSKQVWIVAQGCTRRRFIVGFSRHADGHTFPENPW
jgi:hypothetical protein